MKKSYKTFLLTASAIFCVLGVVSPTMAHAAGPAPINLSSAGNFVVLTKTGISTTGVTSVVGDIGASPVTSTAITGFTLTLPAASSYSTSPQVSGKVYAPDYATPTPAILTVAIADMQTAYTDGAGRTNPTATELGAGNIGGLTIAPGLYKWGTGVTIPTDVTLNGSANDVWIFQIAQTLTVSSSARVILSGGAQASNIFWIVGGQTTLGTGAVFSGNILGQTAIVLNTGATLNGRAFAQTAVTLDSNSVTIPSSSQIYVAPTPIPTSVPTPTPIPTTTTTTTTNTGTSAGTNTNTSSGTNYNIPATPLVAVTNMAQVRMLTNDLMFSRRSSDVTVLQQFLISQNKGFAATALARVGATGYFGGLTRASLAEFQASTGITPPKGFFGPITRAYIRLHY